MNADDVHSMRDLIAYRKETGITYEALAHRLGADPAEPTGVKCVFRLHYRKRCHHYADDNSPHGHENWSAAGKDGCFPPESDHVRLWKKDGKIVAFTSEPYERVDTLDLDAMNLFARKWGFTFEIDPDFSPYYPHCTVLIIWRADSTHPAHCDPKFNINHRTWDVDHGDPAAMRRYPY